MTRLVSIVLFVFVGLTIFFFHNQFADPLQGTLALKNLAIMGGLLMTFAYGQVRGTFDTCAKRRDLRRRSARRARRGQAPKAPRSAAHGGRRRTAHGRSPMSTATGVPEVRPKRRWF
jgi:putative oxidoreductase